MKRTVSFLAFIIVLLTSCGSPAVQETGEEIEAPSQEIQETVSPEFYTESFEHGAKFCIRLMFAENLFLTNEVNEKEYQEFHELYKNVFTTVGGSEKEFKQSQEGFNAFSVKIFGEEAYIEPKTNVDQTAFLDANIFYTSCDLVSLYFLYGSISIEEYEEVKVKSKEALKDITHEKVMEFSDYVMELLMHIEFQQFDPTNIGELT